MYQSDKKPLSTTHIHLSGKKPSLAAYTTPIVKNFPSTIFSDIYFRADILSKVKKTHFL